MKLKTIIPILVIIIVGTFFAWSILKTDSPIKKTGKEESHVNQDKNYEQIDSNTKKGPHGGKLFSEDGLNVEVTIFEKGVPPQFRIYVTGENSQSISLNDISISINLQRLDRIDNIQFAPAGQYLLGDKIVEEPHSFDASILAKWKGNEYNWQFSQIEGRVQILEQAINSAGITFAKAGPSTLKNIIRLTGEISLNEEKVAHVIPRIDGVARKIKKDLGARVKEGETLAILESRELADAKSAYLLSIKQSNISKADLKRESLVYKNTKVMLDLLDKESELDDLYKKLEGLLIGENRSLLLPAYAKIKNTKSVYVREKRLFEKKITSESEYQLALENHKSAEARFLSLREQAEYDGSWTVLQKKKAVEVANLNLQTATQKLFSFGMKASEIKSLPKQIEQNFTRYELRAPISGIVIQKHITPGEAFNSTDNIFLLADLSNVWVNIAVPEKDLKHIKLGQKVNVILDNLDIEETGVLSYLGSVIDEKSRTVTARTVIQNPKELWRPGSFVTVELAREKKNASIGVPQEAIQTIRDWTVVFVKYGNFFEARPIKIGMSDESMVEVISGLRKGEEYVVKNSFAVKAEIEKAGAIHSH
ncbi:MAG: efflux RND transporter periplasmic adaptor subunit [Nitrospinales bacterium]